MCVAAPCMATSGRIKIQGYHTTAASGTSSQIESLKEHDKEETQGHRCHRCHRCISQVNDHLKEIFQLDGGEKKKHD